VAYCTSTDVKTYLGIAGTTDDTLITALITRAQGLIDAYCHRKFEATADTTHYFEVGVDTHGQTLYLDDDLCSITSISNNADGTPEAIASTEYTTIPRNSAPYSAIKLLTSSSKYWRFTTNPEAGVTVTGKWAFSATPPADIVQACARWTAYLYRQKDAQVFDVTAQPDMGVITIPQGMPADVKKALEPYARLV